MSSKTRIHLVKVAPGGNAPIVERLVRAAGKAKAAAHVTNAMVTAEVASQDDLVRLAGAGVQVEDATEAAQ